MPNVHVILICLYFLLCLTVEHSVCPVLMEKRYGLKVLGEEVWPQSASVKCFMT